MLMLILCGMGERMEIDDDASAKRIQRPMQLVSGCEPRLSFVVGAH